MNTVVLIGRLTKEPEVRTSQNGTVYGRFTIAVARDKNTTDYPNIVCLGKTAENVQMYVGKGSLVGVTGRLQTGSYEKDGKKVYTTEVMADRVDFLSKKEEVKVDDVHQKIPEGFSVLDEDIPF